jgi:hypothetical protein
VIFDPDLEALVCRLAALGNTPATRTIRVVEAWFELLAANGTPIGVASAYRNDLAPNETPAFEAVAFDPATASHRLLEIVADRPR